MRLYKRLFNKYIQHKRAVFSDSDSAYSVTMLQSLEPRQMYDAALGVEVANLFTPQIVVQGQEADFLAADTAQATNGNQIVDAFVNDTPIDQQIFPSISYESPDVLTSNTHLDDYYSFDKSLVKEVVFVDSAIENYAELIEGVDLDKLISGQLEVVVLKSDYSGIKQISDYLDQYDHQLDAVHIVSHGSVAELKLGSDTLNTASFDNFKTDLAAWGASFAVGADLLFYGCNVAEGAVGQKFIQDLHSVIETDIAASSDFTGHFNLGGDWDLEVNEGEITAKLAFTAASQMTYEGLLATITVTTLIDEDDVGDQDLAGMAVPDGDGISFREAIAIANSNPGSDTINFSDAISGTITLGSALPNISGATIIDATGHIDFSYTAAVSDKITTSNLQTPIKILAASGNSSLLNFVAGSDDSVVKGLHLALKNPLYNAVSGEVVINAGVNNITIEKNYIATDSVVSSDVQSIYVGYSNTGGQTHTIKDNLIDKNPFVIANFSADAIFIDISGVSSDGSTNDHSITIDHNTIQNVETQAIMTNLGNPFPNNKSLDTYNITNNFFDNIRVHFQDVSVINIGSNNSTGSISNNTFINIRDYSIGLRGNLNSTITISENISTNVSGNIGIDLGNFNAADGATMNDADDIDTGPNALLNFPVLTEILDLGGGVYRIEGYIDSAFTSENRYKIEFFAGDDPLSIQPEFFVGSVTLNNSNSSLEADNGSGSINDRRFTFITSNLTSSGLSLATIRFSATTTDIIGGYTSEVFALNAAAVIPTTIHVTTLVDENDGITTDLASLILNPGGTGISFREAIYVANNTAGTDTIVFDVSGNFVFSIEAAANLKLPAITGTLIIDGTSAPGYVTPVTNVNPNIPSNPTNAGASGLFGVNTTASSNPIGPSQSLLGGVIGSTLDIYDGSNDYEADIKSALDTSGNMKVFFETTNQVGGTSAILQFQSSAANSQVKGIGFLQNSAATSAIRSSVSGVDVIDSYFRGFTSAVSTDGAVVNMDQVTNSVFENSYNAVNQAVLIKHNTIINTSNHVVNQGGDFFYNKVENLGGLIGSGNGSFSGTAGYTTKGNYFNNLNNAGRYNDINFIENEVLNMANTTYAVWAENMVYTTMNKIHDNAGAGIYATAATASGTNRIGAHLANSLYNNGGLGLDVVITGNANAPVGNNTNDFDDLDIYGQNTAYIGQVVQVSSTNGFNGDEGDMIIVGSLNSGNSALAAHSEQFRIDFYANTGGLSGNVNNSEAEYFLGYTIVDATATSTGYKAYFEFTYDYDNPQAGAVANVLLTPGSYILATATGTVPNSATPSGTVFGTSYKTYETSEFSTVGQIIGYTNAQELPTSFTPTIDYTGVITIGNYFTSDSTPILLGESTQPYEANITISIVRIDDNSGGETVVHTANPDDITRDLANGTWEYDLTSYFTAPVGAYRLDVTMDDGSNVALLPGATFSKVFVVAADSNTLGIVGETAYNNATSSYPIEGSVNDSSNPIFIEIDTGDGNGTQILQAIANGPTGWQLTSLPTYNLTDNNVPYVLHVFNNSGSYDTQTIAQGFIVDTINPDVAMNNITGLATALELTGTFVDTNEVTAIIVSIAPTGSMDINNLNPTNTYVVGSDPHSVLNPGFQSVTGLINTASNTWSIDAGQITGLLSGLSYDVVVMGLDPAGNITSLTSGSILSGAITVTQNSDTVLDDILSSLNSLLGDSYLGFSGDYSLTGTDYLDVIDNNTDDVVAAALRAASDAQLAADAALKYAEEAQALADANPANVEYQEAAYAAAQAAEVAQAAADAAQIQANQAQAAQASGDSAAAQQSSASAQAASSAGQAAAQAASGNSSEGGTSGAVAGFTQAFSNVTAGLAGSAGAVANVVFNIALDTMSHKPIESGLAAAAGFTLTLTVISGGQVASVAIASGSAGSGAIAALQNTFTSIFENFSANMLRAGGAPSLSSGSKFKGNVGGAHMSNASAQNQDINQDQQDVEMLEDVDCILSKYVHKVTSKINRQENSVNR